MTSPAVPSLATNRRTGAFERRVARALAAHVDAAEPLLVACSGGPDSLATFVAAARVRPSGTVTAAHFDHRLRPADEVARERAIVQSVCDALGIRLVAGRAARRPADRSEAAAREARYRWLARACGDLHAATCATGHTLDDQAETVLLRLARGTGLRGAGGMEGRSEWPVPVRGRRPVLVRPLLDVPRADIEAYLDALGVCAAHDPSNDTLDYARNRVRARVLPELRAVNPRAAHQIAAFAAGAREDDLALDAWAVAAFTQLQNAEQPDGESEVRLDRAGLLALPTAVARRVVRQAATRLGLTLERDQVAAALHAAGARDRRAALGRGVEAVREGDTLALRRVAQISGNLPVTR
ncbi:MAG: tRNA lysidine(34) synthetase TilS [Dehalococcoidia bacterium]